MERVSRHLQRPGCHSRAPTASVVTGGLGAMLSGTGSSGASRCSRRCRREKARRSILPPTHPSSLFSQYSRPIDTRMRHHGFSAAEPQMKPYCPPTAAPAAVLTLSGGAPGHLSRLSQKLVSGAQSCSSESSPASFPASTALSRHFAWKARCLLISPLCVLVHLWPERGSNLRVRLLVTFVLATRHCGLRNNCSQVGKKDGQKKRRSRKDRKDVFCHKRS